MNKKVIFVILLFIGISFIVYSFASPLTNEDSDLSQNNGGNQTENNNSYDKNKDDEIDNSDIIDKKDDDEQDKDVENKDSDSEEQQIVVTPPTVTTPTQKYYCKFVNNRYYGSTGLVVSYKTYLNQCVATSTPDPTPIPDPTPEPIVPDPTPEEPQGPSTLFASTIELDKDPSIVVPLTVTDNIKDEATSTNYMTLTGVMQQKSTLVDGITTGYYVTLKLYVPKEFTTKESLNDLTVTTKSKVLTQAENNLVKEDANGYYIVWNQAFRKGGVYSITVNWNEDTVATYKITCNIDTF